MERLRYLLLVSKEFWSIKKDAGNVGYAIGNSFAWDLAKRFVAEKREINNENRKTM